MLKYLNAKGCCVHNLVLNVLEKIIKIKLQGEEENTKASRATS